MTELPSNDYISQINQNGSGLNIPQIVGALVDANIEPKDMNAQHRRNQQIT